MDRKKLARPLWIGGAVIAAGLGVFFLVQFVLSYYSMAERAVEDGKRVIIAVDTGEVTIRAANDKQESTSPAPKKPIAEKPVTENPAPATPGSGKSPEAQTQTAPATPQAKQEVYGPYPQGKEPAAPSPAVAADAAKEAPAAEKSATDAAPAPAEAVVYDGKARLAVVINGLGLNRSITEDVTKLPSGVALAFSPYVDNLGNWVDAVGKSGHEVLIDLPMETLDYPQFDPGPLAILNDADKAKNIFHLKSALSAAKTYVGVLTPVDETITKSLTTILPLIDELAKQHTLLVYNEKPANTFLKQEAGAVGLPVIAHYVVVDEVLSADAIDAQLEAVRKMILEEQKTVLVLGRPYPLTIKRIELWLQMLKEKHGIEVSPISTIVNS